MKKKRRNKPKTLAKWLELLDHMSLNFRKPIAPPSKIFKSKKDYNRQQSKKIAKKGFYE